jgi:methionyl-tRNA formyltransferase
VTAPLRVVFFGSPAFAVPSLRALADQPGVHLVAVVSQPDRPAGRGQTPAPPAVKVAATALGVPVLQPEKIRTPETLAALAALDADLFVVVAYGRILPQQLLDLPRLGPWNVHASLLPRLRGAAPIQWSIIRGEARTGVSIMRMEAGLDTGPVAAVRALDIADDDTAGTLSDKLAPLGAGLLAETLPSIAAGAVALATQDHAAATLAPILTKADGHLTFDRPARAVSAHARGVDPWPGASAVLDGAPLKLFAPRVVEADIDVGIVGSSGRPGEVLGLRPEGLAVACAGGAIAFGELQLPGRKRLPAAAVLSGHRVPAGTVLA